jgi:hypothetical protein
MVYCIINLKNVNELCDRIVRDAECVSNEMLASRETDNGAHIETYCACKEFVNSSV